MEKIRRILEYIRSEERFYNRILSAGRWTGIFFAILAGLAIVWGALLFWVDPYVCWHRAVGLTQVYDNAHAMIPGVLRHEEYDTVLIGTSLSRNSLISDVDGTFHCKSVKATAAGTAPGDLDQYIAHAARHPETKHVILELNLIPFGVHFGKGRWYEYRYLYEYRRFPVPYLLSSDTFKAVFDVFVTNLAGPKVKGATLQKDRNRMFSGKVYRLRFDFDELLAMIHIRSIPLSRHSNDVMLQNLRETIFRRIRENPGVKFDVFLPPVSVFTWNSLHEMKNFEVHMTGRELAAEELLKFPNVTLHDCQAAESLICDLTMYGDILHFSPGGSALVLKRILAGTDLVRSVEKIRANNGRIRRLMEKYDPMYQAIVHSKADKNSLTGEIRRKFPGLSPARVGKE